MPASAEAPQELLIQLCLCRFVPGLRHASRPSPGEPDAKGNASAQGTVLPGPGLSSPSDRTRMIRRAALRPPHDRRRAAVPQDTQIAPFGRALDSNAEDPTTAHNECLSIGHEPSRIRNVMWKAASLVYGQFGAADNRPYCPGGGVQIIFFPRDLPVGGTVSVDGVAGLAACCMTRRETAGTRPFTAAQRG
jgi:hypothetical protein